MFKASTKFNTKLVCNQVYKFIARPYTCWWSQSLTNLHPGCRKLTNKIIWIFLVGVVKKPFFLKSFSLLQAFPAHSHIRFHWLPSVFIGMFTSFLFHCPMLSFFMPFYITPSLILPSHANSSPSPSLSYSFLLFIANFPLHLLGD